MSDRWRPAPPSGGLRRERLIRALDDAVDTGVALVVAPVGTGKTTLLEHWAHRRARPAQWIRPSDPAGVRSLVTGITTASGRGSRTVIVDDAHDIPAEDIEAVQVFIERAAPQTTVLVASRTMPALNLARREFPRPVVLTGEELRFRPREIAQLYRDVYGEGLGAFDAVTLARETDGWAAALHLHHLAVGPTQRGQARRAAASRPMMNDRYVQDYLAHEVLRPLPPLLVRFLRFTSVFDTVTVGRCDRLLGWTGSRQALADLARREGLVQREPGQPETYRYNAVLRDQLRLQLREELGTAGFLALQQSAAGVLANGSDVPEEASARARAADWTGLSELVRAHGEQLTHPRASWPRLLPSDVREGNPWFLLAESRRLLADGLLAEAEDAARRAATDMVQEDGVALCLAVTAEAQLWSRTGVGLDPLAAWSSHPDATRLLSAALAVLVDGLDPAESLDLLHAECSALGQTWQSRMALAVGLTRDDTGAGPPAVLRLARKRRGLGDAMGAFLLEGAVALAGYRAGRPDLQLLEQLVVRARGLGSATAEAWLRAAFALAAADADLPEAALAAQSAEAVARSAGVVGAQATAYAALAIVTPGSRDDLLALADALLSPEAVGREDGSEPAAVPASGTALEPTRMPVIRPWEWLTGSAERLRDASLRQRAQPTEPHLDVQCLGVFRLSVDGREVDLTSVRPVARSVLRALAIRAGEPVHRDRLIEEFWPTRRPAAGLHNLHVAISALRGALDAEVPGDALRLLARDGDAYVFAPGRRIVTDLQRVHAQLRIAADHGREGHHTAQAAALRAALELYAADILPEDGPAEWVVQPRERWRLKLARAATRLADLELRAGDLRAAIAAAERALELDQWSDAAWRALVAAHTRAGDRVAAGRARHDYERLLASLGVDESGVATRPATEGAATGAGQVIPLDPAQDRLKKATSATANRRLEAAP